MLSISTAIPLPQTPVSALCIFLRYSPHHKDYKCLSSTCRIYLARTVTFNEQYFPYHELFLLPSSTNHLPSSTTYHLPRPPPFPILPHQAFSPSPSPLIHHVPPFSSFSSFFPCSLYPSPLPSASSCISTFPGTSSLHPSHDHRGKMKNIWTSPTLDFYILLPS